MFLGLLIRRVSVCLWPIVVGGQVAPHSSQVLGDLVVEFTSSAIAWSVIVESASSYSVVSVSCASKLYRFAVFSPTSRCVLIDAGERAL